MLIHINIDPNSILSLLLMHVKALGSQQAQKVVISV